MKPMIFVPPAQAEALYDTQVDPRDDFSLDDQAARQPWRDDDLPELKTTVTPSVAGFRRLDRTLAERPA